MRKILWQRNHLKENGSANIKKISKKIVGNCVSLVIKQEDRKEGNCTSEISERKFFVHESTYEIPLSLKNFNENNKSNCTKVALAFEEGSFGEKDRNDYPVFNMLPITCVGFPFIINADWNLISSREVIFVSISIFLSELVGSSL